MATKTLAHLGLGFVIASCLTAVAPAADVAALDGQWKLVVPTISNSPLWIVKLSGPQDQLKGEVVGAQEAIFAAPRVSKVERQGDKLSIEIVSEASKDLFAGSIAKEGGKDQPILGTYRLRDNLFPARLERTDDAKLGALVRPELVLKVFQAARQPDAKAKRDALHQLVKENPGDPNLRIAYMELLRGGDVSLDDARTLVADWLKGAAPYGNAWTAETRTLAIVALGDEKKFAPLKFELAEAAAKALPPDATTEQQSAIARAVMDSATALGKADIAAAARQQWQKLEAKLDEEYHAKVPPFAVEPFAGRKDPRDNRVVVMELFTGAQCPPCVAADVGFDALLSTYKPAELIGLQYHLHIPGPDPLTNPDSVARSEYYNVQGTPSTYFNGKDAGGGGGGMGNAKSKYDEFVGIIDGDLAAKRGGKIDLKLSRSGDTVHVNVTAEVKPDAAAKAGAKRPAAAAGSAAADDKDGDAKEKKDADGKEPKLRLRLVLVEEAIRYPGGNKLRFHHHVVRGMPGGPEGKEVVAGACQWQLPINLTAVHDELDKYLAEFAQERSFPQALPPIELANLSVVALVQDDATKRILDAVVVPVPDGK